MWSEALRGRSRSDFRFEIPVLDFRPEVASVVALCLAEHVSAIDGATAEAKTLVLKKAVISLDLVSEVAYAGASCLLEHVSATDGATAEAKTTVQKKL